MTLRIFASVGLLIVFTLTVTRLTVAAEQAAPPKRVAGKNDDGFLLPNGWTLTPAGEQVTLTDMPLGIVPLADNRYALVASSGYNQHELCLVDLADKKIVASERARQSWFGLATSAAQDQVWWSGGGADMLHTYSLKGNQLARTGADEPDESKRPKDERKADRRFRSGVALSRDGKKLYSLDINSGSLREINLASPGEDRVAKIGVRPYDLLMARNGSRLYVSDWADRKVLAVDPADLRVVARIGVGEHPNQLALHPQDDRLFVSCASSNCVSVIDTRRGVVTESIFTTLFPKAPEGSTPDAVAVSPDGETLFVANADNNCIVVVDIEEPNESQVKGMIPTGWYPTAVAVTPDGKNLLVGVGKGNQTKPNPISPKLEPQDKDQVARRGLPFPYIGTTLSGALSIIPIPTDEQLAAFTERVYKNCPYSDKLLAGTPADVKTAVPTKIGDPSPIKHIIYIIKENRTYDQVFGDIPGSNADPSLVMFGEEITPNHHKLAREFVLLDNLYCNGQVSRDGHPWSTMAYNTDYVARDWTLTYSGREG
ncbi:MAG: hypothetical protein ABUL64_02915, partial [Singulisphaera sp.]